jgi:predicted RNA-binding protein associated with RNAse of E/G family
MVNKMHGEFHEPKWSDKETRMKNINRYSSDDILNYITGIFAISTIDCNFKRFSSVNFAHIEDSCVNIFLLCRNNYNDYATDTERKT